MTDWQVIGFGILTLVNFGMALANASWGRNGRATNCGLLALFCLFLTLWGLIR